jgi:RNA polymerase sigma factor (sigma-70 family)
MSEAAKLGSELEDLLWHASGPDVQCQAPTLLARLARQGLHTAQVLELLSDETLALAVQNDFWLPDAFAELFHKRARRSLAIWYYGWRVAPELAEDLTQELFKRFWVNRLRTYQPQSSFQAYLRVAAWNLLDEKRRRHFSRHLVSLNHTAEPNDRGGCPVEEAVGRELEERLNSVLDQLPAQEGAVLRLTIDGMSADEIAEELGVGKQVVYRRLFHARRKIEEQLGL